jgi:hypothetical protein
MECSEIERRTIPVEEEVAFPYIIISPQSISIVSFPCTQHPSVFQDLIKSQRLKCIKPDAKRIKKSQFMHSLKLISILL